ncbi:hypothetical protein F4859DRAFT_371401 [Xylaria cf. heliscus]|nr:hypothetical protein F4859DRAFT_371401 [Xylaria cf. heliscus]
MREAFNTTSVGWLTIILGWVLSALALLSVTIYIWSKIINRAAHHLDDVLLYLSLLISLVLMSVTTWAVVVEGQGRHQSAESRSQFDLVAKSLLINEILWGIVNTSLRIGAILFIRKVVLLRQCTTILLVASVGYAIAVIATSLAICQPISASWDETVLGRCGNQVVSYLCLEIISAILDLVIIIAPLPPLMRLRMPLKRKWLIYALFSLGSVVFIITGLRIAALNRVNTHDFSYDQGYIGLLSILGPLIAIICCCTTASAGIVYRRFQQWAESRGFSSLNVIWSISTLPSRWRSSMATNKGQETKSGGVLSRFEPPGPAPTLELSERNSIDTAMSTSTRLQSLTETQSVDSPSTVSILDKPSNSTNE